MTLLDTLVQANALARMRDGDATLFSDDPAEQATAAASLGFTTLASDAAALIPELTDFAEEVRSAGITDVVLLGMGGSSLAALVISSAIGSTPGYPTLHVLDTTSPESVAATCDSLDPATTLCIVASKSGGTVEPNALYAVFRERAEKALGAENAGRHFVAITDEGSSLDSLAQDSGFRRVFRAKNTVGGRYSALTHFGLVPAAVIGIDLAEFVERALAVERHLAAAPTDQSDAAALATIMAGAQANGLDKLTLVTSPGLASFGLWVEQLVAESLGKAGTGIVPVPELSSAPPIHAYGEDRLIAVVRFASDDILAAWSGPAAMERALFSFELSDPYDVAGQFVVWEWAVPLTGFLLGVNPFGQPDVAAAKEATTSVLAGKLSAPAPTSRIAGADIAYSAALAAPASPPATLASALAPALECLREGDFLGVLAFLPDEDALLDPMRGACAAVANSTGRAVVFELGPRYLHSTGQLYKGGPDSGVYVVVTARDGVDTVVPGRPWTLRQLHRAQAEGDLAVLAERGRRVVRVDLADASAASVGALADALADLALGR